MYNTYQFCTIHSVRAVHYLIEFRFQDIEQIYWTSGSGSLNSHRQLEGDGKREKISTGVLVFNCRIILTGLVKEICEKKMGKEEDK